MEATDSVLTYNLGSPILIVVSVICKRSVRILSVLRNIQLRNTDNIRTDLLHITESTIRIGLPRLIMAKLSSTKRFQVLGGVVAD